HLFEGVLRRLRIVSLRENAASGADLDHVSAVLDVLANLVLDGCDAVGHAVSHLVIADGQKVFVAMAASDAKRRSADLHMRTRDLACFDGVTQIHIYES